MAIETTLQKNPDGTNSMLVKVVLDKELFESIQKGEFAGIGSRVAKDIADYLLPEMRATVLEDPVMKDRIVNEVLLILANRISQVDPLQQQTRAPCAKKIVDNVGPPYYCTLPMGHTGVCKRINV